MFLHEDMIVYKEIDSFSKAEQPTMKTTEKSLQHMEAKRAFNEQLESNNLPVSEFSDRLFKTFDESTTSIKC